MNKPCTYLVVSYFPTYIYLYISYKMAYQGETKY
jgi:hypothetical protein